MFVTFEGFDVPYRHRWPAGEEEYQGAMKFRTEIMGRPVPIVIAFGEREAFGANRKRVLVIVKNSVMLELAGTDNYNSTGLLIGGLKKPKSEESYREVETIPPELSRFNVVYHKHHIRRGRDHLAVLFNISDVKGMIDYGLTRARLEK